MGTDHESLIERIEKLEKANRNSCKARAELFLSFENKYQKAMRDEEGRWDPSIETYEEFQKTIKYIAYSAQSHAMFLLEEICNSLFDSLNEEELRHVIAHYEDIKKIEGLQLRTEIEFLYHTNYWDGPLAGMCSLNGQKYWYNCCYDLCEIASKRPRIFTAYELTQEQIDNEEYWHTAWKNNEKPVMERRALNLEEMKKAFWFIR